MSFDHESAELAELIRIRCAVEAIARTVRPIKGGYIIPAASFSVPLGGTYTIATTLERIVNPPTMGQPGAELFLEAIESLDGNATAVQFFAPDANTNRGGILGPSMYDLRIPFPLGGPVSIVVTSTAVAAAGLMLLWRVEGRG